MSPAYRSTEHDRGRPIIVGEYPLRRHRSPSGEVRKIWEEKEERERERFGEDEIEREAERRKQASIQQQDTEFQRRPAVPSGLIFSRTSGGLSLGESERARIRREQDEEEAIKQRLEERQLPTRRISVGSEFRRHRIVYKDGMYRYGEPEIGHKTDEETEDLGLFPEGVVGGQRDHEAEPNEPNVEQPHDRENNTVCPECGGIRSSSIPGTSTCTNPTCLLNPLHHANPDPGEYPDDDSETTADNGSVFSDSDGVSSRSSLADRVGATEEFVALLLSQDTLVPLLRESSALTDGDSFKQEFRTSLSKLSKDLDKCATKAMEVLAAKLVRHSRRKVSLAIWREVYESDPNQRIGGKLQKGNLSKAKIMEAYLKSMNGDDPEENNRLQKTDTGDNSSDDEDMYCNLPNLKQVRDFIVTGPAFAKFQDRYSDKLKSHKDSTSSNIKEPIESPVCLTPTTNSRDLHLTNNNGDPVDNGECSDPASVSSALDTAVFTVNGVNSTSRVMDVSTEPSGLVVAKETNALPFSERGNQTIGESEAGAQLNGVNVSSLSKKNVRIQDNHVFHALALRLSVLVVLYSALYIMLPSSRKYLIRSDYIPSSATWFSLGKFMVAFVGIQIVSRFLHHYSSLQRPPPRSGTDLNNTKQFPVTFLSYKFIRDFPRRIKRMLRPPVPPSHRRLEWQEECGTWLYDDFNDSDPSQLDELYRELTDHGAVDTVELNHSAPPSGNQSDNASLPAGQVDHPASSDISLQAMSSPEPLLTGNTSSTKTTSTPTTAIPDEQATYPMKMYFAMCVNTGENLAVLGEIDVSTIHHDGEWFSKMWAEYDKLRGFRSAYLRKLLIKPVDIKYIQFTVEEHQRADISFDPPQIPPPQEVAARNYEYAPCPLTTRPSPQTFLHYRQCKSCTGRRDKKKQMFRRLPKKLHRALLDVYLRAEPDEDVFGWGVLVVEGPNSTGITWLGALMLTFCAIVSIVYTVISKDASAGFTIGAFMTSVWVAWLTAFYFRWKDQ